MVFMKVFVLYHEDSDHARAVTEFAHDFEHQTAKTVELFDMDTRDGVEKAKLYDITSYPAVVAVRDDAHCQKTRVAIVRIRLA